jgi:hypothetical protein
VFSEGSISTGIARIVVESLPDLVVEHLPDVCQHGEPNLVAQHQVEGESCDAADEGSGRPGT